MATFMGNRGFGSGIFRPVLLIASICLLMFLLYAYSSTNSELKVNKDRADRLARQQDMLKTQVKDLLDARGKLEKDLQKMQVEQGRCIRDTEQLKKSYTSQIESMKETLKFRISSLENENSELQSRAGSYEEKYNELTAARKKDQDLFASAQQKCHETTQKLEAQNAELNVQMTDMQRNLDAFRLDRLRSESIRQNCSNQLALTKMKLDQLQEDFQRMTTKLKVMGNAFNDNLPAVQKKSVTIDNGGNSSPSPMNRVHNDSPDHRDDSLTKKDVLYTLQKKLANGEHLQNNERLLYQALTKEASESPQLQHQKQTQDGQNNPEVLSKLPDMQKLPKLTQDHQNNPEVFNKLPDLQQQPRQALDHKDTPEWFNNLPAEHRQSVSKETQDLLHKQGHNIPAPPFLGEYKANQQQQQQKETLHFDDKHVGDDQKTFEQDQRDEERRLFEMFQGDNNHGKDEDLKDDEDEKLTQDNELYGDDKDDGNEDDDDDYKEKDDNYVYGGQDRQVNPDTQDNDALI